MKQAPNETEAAERCERSPSALSAQHTHFKYLCRICKQEKLQPILQDAPEKTEIPACCSSSRRDMAFKGTAALGPTDSKCSD